MRARWLLSILAALPACVTQPDVSLSTAPTGPGAADVASRIECKFQPQIWPYPPGLPTEFPGLGIITLVAYDEGEIPVSTVRLEFWDAPPVEGGNLLNRDSTPLHCPTSAIFAWPVLPQPVTEFQYDPALSFKVDDGDPHVFWMQLRHPTIDFIIYSLTGPWYVNPILDADPIDVSVGTTDIGVHVGTRDITTRVGP